MKSDDTLQQIFDADRALRTAQQAFFADGDDNASLDAIQKSLDASSKLSDGEESTARLMRLGTLLGEIGGARACAMLLRLLDHEEPEVRLPAGESLAELAYSRYAEVARAIEKVIDDGKATTALSEVPYILAEIGEPGGVKLCQRLLKHTSGDVVASSIEALAQFGDASVIKDIEKLKSDRRMVSIDEDPDAEQVPLGDLAQEAIDHLRSLDV